MKKLFIVFEGIDSCGKTTQAELLKNYLIERGEQAVISSEPSNGIIGNIIRQALKQKIIFSNANSHAPEFNSGERVSHSPTLKDIPADKDSSSIQDTALDNRNLFDEQMAYLFAADRHDHLYNDIDGVYKLIKDNYHVISTRYYFSSLAYNCDTPEKFAFIQKLNHRFPNPDLTIYIDLPIEVSLLRLQERSSKEIYENKSKLTKVREQYQQIFADYQGKAIAIDGTADIQNIHQQIVDFINNNFE